MRGNIAVMIMRVDGQIENVQRRTFYRLECLLDAEYGLHITDANNENPSFYKKAVVKNISGSGACIIVEDAVAKNILLDLDIHFDYGDIKMVCKVVRTAVIESSKGRKHELGVHFTEISPKERDIIIRYVFEQQRLLLKKEVTGR
jgi:c-di-GMP-binding flagellar brake protein YcgR